MKEGKEQKEELGGAGGLLGLFGLKGQAEVRGNEWNQENIARHTVIHSWAEAGGPDISCLVTRKHQLFTRNLETGWADSCPSELCPSESDMSQPSAWQQREMATACSWVLPGHSQLRARKTRHAPSVQREREFLWARGLVLFQMGLGMVFMLERRSRVNRGVCSLSCSSLLRLTEGSLKGGVKRFFQYPIKSSQCLFDFVIQGKGPCP